MQLDRYRETHRIWLQIKLNEFSGNGTRRHPDGAKPY